MSAAGQTHRLASGGLIDRGKPLDFSFDGKSCAGFQGDTLASALIANGVKLVGRSFKYHRPRGILTAGSEEPNALVELRSGARREPNTRATTTELYDGLIAASQNRWPSLNFDLLSVNQLASPIFVAGFYYKTFMWPAKLWETFYEPLIRRAAGLGRARGRADPDHYEKAWAHCDVLIAGGGPTGLAAALAAGRAGARVILCEEDVSLGGRLLSDGGMIDGLPATDWVAQAVAELAAMPDVSIMTRTTVTGVYRSRHLCGARTRQRSSAGAAGASAAPATLAHRCEAHGGRGRRARAAGRLRRQRHAWRHAGFGHAHLHQPLCRGAGKAASRCSPTMTTAGRRSSAALGAGLTVAGVVDARADVSAEQRALAAKHGFAVLNGVVDAVDGGKDGHRQDLRRACRRRAGRRSRPTGLPFPAAGTPRSD